MGLLINERNEQFLILSFPFLIAGGFSHINIPQSEKHLPKVVRDENGCISGDTVIDNSWENDQDNIVDEIEKGKKDGHDNDARKPTEKMSNDR